ncbi:MAG: sodium/solute symporter [Eubacterium sp.]|nr:sodium/solute symporter [Eubacterium sp.]
MGVIEALKNNGFTVWDYGVVILYIAILVGMGIFLSRKKSGEEKSANDYFLAGNSLTWWAVGASLIAANISAEQFIGMSGSAYKSGIAMAAYELMAAAALIVVAKFLLPVMMKNKIVTIPQFLRTRYNKGTGLAFSIFWLFLYIFINLTSVAWLGALAIKQILGLPGVKGNLLGMEVDYTLVVIILILFLIAGIYSIYGGLASVAWTDVMQVVFLVGGGLITAIATLSVIGKEMGGVGPIGALGKIAEYLRTIPGDKHLELIVTRSTDLTDITKDAYFDIPGVVVIIGALWLTNLGYWGFNQYIVQKGLAAKSLSEARKGLLFAAFLKVLIPFIVCIPGVCAFYIANCPDAEGIRAGLEGTIARSDDAYPFLIHNFTPVIIKGLSFAALSAAVISSLASMFNSTSTIFTMDIYKEFINKKASEKKLVTVGRVTSICALVMALIAAYPIMGGADQAFQVVQEYSGFVYPGIVVIFGLGLLWKRASGKGAVAAAIGTFAFSILFKVVMPNEPFLFRMGYVFMAISILFIVISLLDKETKPAEELEQKDINKMLMGSRISFIVFLLTLVTGIFAMCMKTMRDYGMEAMFFTSAAALVMSIFLKSDAKDKVENAKSIGIDLKLFETDGAFEAGAIGIIAMITCLYILFW